MKSMYFEDFDVGRKFSTSTRTILDEDIKNFFELSRIRNRLFTDDEYIKKSIHKGKIIPGPLTFILATGLFTRLGIMEDTAMAFLGMDKMRLPMPVRPGDTIRVEVEITETIETKKPDRGVVKETFSVMNQRDEIVLTYEMAHLIKRRQ